MHKVMDLTNFVESHVGAAPLRWERMSWPQIQAMRDGGGDMVLLPVGATEQHGRHLPVNVDSIFAEAFCLYASARTGVPVMPCLTYGCSLGHTQRWPGTISLMPETVSAIVREIATFLIQTGFKRLLIVNSHYGNVPSLRCAIDRIRFDNAGRFQVGLRSTFDITPAVWAKFTDDGVDFHANRAETALMQFIAPELVDAREIEDDPDRTEGEVFTHVVPHTSRNGLTGYPSRATPGDGRKLFFKIGDALSALVASARHETPPLL